MNWINMNQICGLARDQDEVNISHYNYFRPPDGQ